eukprot:TRINITY_DN593_c0_g1_i2.p1 TRINITY_DN593_c0_g1~~TRINITY_DN593_c0_g1_i2.p1  ORF type:complete len:391 (-),score=95.60 TRINITY_DN593_c0_g1_i2:35-1207(-)
MRLVTLFLSGLVAAVVGDRVITLKNNCASKVFFALTPGGAPNVYGSGSACNSDADCITGAFCKKPSTNLCFWKLPSSISAGGGFGLAPGESRQMVMPYLAQSDVVWSGGIGACIEGQMCWTTDFNKCNSDGCASSGGVTLTEFTLSKYGTDFYDVSIINGVSVPMEMVPNVQGGKDDYTCRGAGSKADGYNWNFNPPSNDYVWVTLESNLRSCNSDNDCSALGSEFVCGTSRNPAGNIFKKSCGKKLGYWSADQICGMNPNQGAPFNCQVPSTDAGSGLRMVDYLLCRNGISSCYAANAPSNCCGCADWWEIGIPEVSSNSTRCRNKSNFWNSQVLPTLKFLKQGCPKCYTYPFDDMTSTFVCSNGNPGTRSYNTVSYSVNFCPTYSMTE